MSTPEERLNHFLIYDITPIDVNYPGATLEGQFDGETGPREVNINIMSTIATPVSKNGGMIVDENAHFTGYTMRVERPEPERTIVIENQFGEQTIRTGLGNLLLVPAEKVEPGLSFPETLDHYKCYRVVAGDPVTASVSLEDQFGGRKGVAVTTPSLFCVPVEKIFRGTTYPIINEADHLMVYSVDTRDFEIKKEFRDQFGETTVKILRNGLLAVPTTKLEVVVEPRQD